MFAGGREFVEVSSTLHALAELFARAQADLDHAVLASAEALQKADEIGFSLETGTWVTLRDSPPGQVLPLSSMVPHRRYQFDRLAIELAAIPEGNVVPRSLVGAPRLRFVGRDTGERGAHPALISIGANAQGVVAELAIKGEKVGSVTLGWRPGVRSSTSPL